MTRIVFPLLIVSTLGTAAHAGDEYTLAAVAVGADAQATQAAVDVARIAREVVQADPNASAVSLEKILQNGAEPAWVERVKEAERAREKGKNAVDSVELPVAADAYAEALVKYEQGIAGVTDLTPVIDVLARGGAVLVLQGDKSGGQKQFERALTLDPAYRLSKEGNNARVLKAFDDVVKDRKGAGEGTLTVFASTGAAEVWVDGVHRGTAPMSLPMPAGRHYVRVVRDGYAAFGGTADVKRGSEASVQASLTPTERLSKFEDQTARMVREKDITKTYVELASFLQVDRLLGVVVEDNGGSATLTAIMVDGVSGKELGKASKAFSPKDNFWDHDVRSWLSDVIRGKSADTASDPVVTNGGTGRNGTSGANGSDESMLPGDAEEVGTPGAVIGGWVMLGIAVLPVASTITFGIISYNLYDAYRNKLPSQLDPQLEPIRSTWLITSIVTDVSGVVAAGLIIGGIAALVAGYNEQSAREEVLAP